jgi:hypothetical protein
MARIIETTTRRRLSARLVAGTAICAILAFGTFAGSASAGETGGAENAGGYYHHYYDGGYYQSPPVVYGSPYGSSYYGYSPYYNPPPVVYGPSVGVSLPFIGIGIR